MKHFNTFTHVAVASLFFVLTVMSGGVAGALSEVWLGNNLSTGGVKRYDLAGNLLGSFSSGSGIDAMTTVGNEVWIGNNLSTGGVKRYDIGGNFVGSFTSGAGIDAMTPVPEPNTALLLGVGLIGLSTSNGRRVSR